MQVRLNKKAIERLVQSIESGPIKNVEGYVIKALEEHGIWAAEAGKAECKAAEAAGDQDLAGLKDWMDGYLAGAATAHALARNVVTLIGLGVPPSQIPYKELIPGSQKDAGLH